MPRVLIIEDDADNRRVLTELFTREDWKVLQANDGDTGVELALRNRPELILRESGRGAFAVQFRSLERARSVTAETPVVWKCAPTARSSFSMPAPGFAFSVSLWTKNSDLA